MGSWFILLIARMESGSIGKKIDRLPSMHKHNNLKKFKTMKTLIIRH